MELDDIKTNRFEQHLIERGFKIENDFRYRSHVFNLLAVQKRVGIKLGTTTQHIFVFVSKFPSIDITDLNHFSSDCRRYAKRHRIIPYFPLIGSVICFPIAITQNANSNLIQELLDTNSIVGIGYIEIPVIFDYAKEESWYSEKTPWCGQLALPYARSILHDLLHLGIRDVSTRW